MQRRLSRRLTQSRLSKEKKSASTVRHEKLEVDLPVKVRPGEIWSADPVARLCISSVTKGMQRKQQAFGESIEAAKALLVVEAQTLDLVEGKQPA